MKLTEKAIAKINDLGTRLLLASALGVTETWIRECIKNNKPNGILTTYTALQVIQSATGLELNKILEGSKLAA